MRFSEIIMSSLTTLKSQGRRTFLTMIGIIIGIAAVITILSLGNGFQKRMTDNLSKDEQGRPWQDFQFNLSDYDQDISRLHIFEEADFDLVRSVPGVVEVKKDDRYTGGPEMETISRIQKEDFLYLDSQDFSSQDMILGRNLTQEDSQGRRTYAIIDMPTAQTFFDDPNQALGQSLKIQDHWFTVVGIFNPPLVESFDMFSNEAESGPTVPAQVIIPSGTHKRVFPQHDMFHFNMLVFFEPDTDTNQASKQIQQILNDQGQGKNSGNYEYFDRTEMIRTAGQTLSMATLFISAVAGISLFIAGVGVMNMMYISVSERTQEIGIRRSIGATQRNIQWQFLSEGIAITALGGLIGYGAGILISLLVGRFTPFPPIFDLKIMIISVLISVAIGIIFSVFPARAAARKNVVDILR